jgi:hypothetical protein
MGGQNVAKIDGSPSCSQQFETDGVHLTKSAGKVFAEGLIVGTDAFFTEVLIDLEKETAGTTTGLLKDPNLIHKELLWLKGR